MSDEDKRERLAVLEAAFDENGGRGVDMAEEIDSLREEISAEDDLLARKGLDCE